MAKHLSMCLLITFKELQFVCEAQLPFAHEISETQSVNCSISLAEVISIHLSTQYILFLHVSSLITTSRILAYSTLEVIS